MARLARWDRDTADRPDRYVAISHYVAGRIARYYNRDSSVVYPPVDTVFFAPDHSVPDRYALIVSALVPYKRVEVGIEACRLARVPLKIVGEGPDRRSLEQLASASPSGVEFSRRHRSAGRSALGSIGIGASRLLHEPGAVMDQVERAVAVQRRASVDIGAEHGLGHQPSPGLRENLRRVAYGERHGAQRGLFWRF